MGTPYIPNGGDLQSAIDPPIGQISQFLAPNPILARCIAALTTLTILVTVVFASRVYTQRHISRQWAVEDWLCAFAWLLLTVYGGTLTYVAYHYNGGMHAWNLTLNQVDYFRRWENVLYILYCPTMLAIKFSILLLYARYFVVHRCDDNHKFILGTITAFSLFYIVNFFLAIVECVPRERIFDKSVDGTCINANALLQSSAGFNLLIDLFVWVFPLHKVHTMSTPRRKKWVAGVILLLGVMYVQILPQLSDADLQGKIAYNDKYPLGSYLRRLTQR